MEPKPADFILVHVPGQGGTAIQLLQWLDGSGFGDFEHVALYIGNQLCIEMSGNGIKTNRVPNYLAKPHRWSSGLINPTDVQRKAIVQAAQHYQDLGVGYAWEDYAALALHHFRVPTPHLKSYIASSRHMICSQFVDQCYVDGGFQLFDDGRWPGYVTPGDLNQRLGGT